MLLLILQDQAQKIRWTPIVIFAALVVGVIVLSVYVLGRFKRANKETDDEEWDRKRSSLLSADIAEAPPARKTQDASKSASSAGRGEEPELQPSHSGQPGNVASRISPPTEDTGPGSISIAPGNAAQGSSVVPQPSAAEAPVAETQGASAPYEAPNQPEIPSGTATLGSTPPPQSGSGIFETPVGGGDIGQPETFGQAEPFGEDIWSEIDQGAPSDARASQESSARPAQLRAPEPLNPPDTRRVAEGTGGAVEVEAHKLPYEPPRIEVIRPAQVREDSGKEGRAPVSSKQITPSEGKYAPAPPAPASRQTAGVTPPTQEYSGGASGPGAIRAGSGSRGRAAGGGSKRAAATPDQRASGQMSTLFDYGKVPDEPGGRGASIALLVVLGIILIGVGSYFGISSVHSKVNGLVARIRQPQSTAPPPPQIQIFSSRGEPGENGVVVKAAVQNVSSQPLTGLHISLTLKPLSGASPKTIDVPITPDPLNASDQGAFQFDFDAKQYQNFRINGVKDRTGADIPFAAPKEGQ